jgi:hypothetical protein
LIAFTRIASFLSKVKEGSGHMDVTHLETFFDTLTTRRESKLLMSWFGYTHEVMIHKTNGTQEAEEEVRYKERRGRGPEDISGLIFQI